jgi:hypothetical protein
MHSLRRRIETSEAQHGKNLLLRRYFNLVRQQLQGGGPSTTFDWTTAAGDGEWLDTEFRDVGPSSRGGSRRDTIVEYLKEAAQIVRKPFFIVRGHQHNNELGPLNSTANLVKEKTQQQPVVDTPHTPDVTGQVTIIPKGTPSYGISTWTSAPSIQHPSCRIPAANPEELDVLNTRIWGPGCGFGMVDVSTSSPVWTSYWDRKIRDEQKNAECIDAVPGQKFTLPADFDTKWTTLGLSLQSQNFTARQPGKRQARMTMLDQQIQKIAVVGDLHGNWAGFQWNMEKLATEARVGDRSC